MGVIHSINDGSDGMWRILRDRVPLHDRLPFAQAIRLARQIARDEHASTGATATVEIMPGGYSSFELSRFGQVEARAYHRTVHSWQALISRPRAVSAVSPREMHARVRVKHQTDLRQSDQRRT